MAVLKSVSAQSTVTGQQTIIFTHSLGSSPDVANIQLVSHTSSARPRLRLIYVNSTVAIWHWSNVTSVDSITFVCSAKIDHSIANGPQTTGVVTGTDGVLNANGDLIFSVKQYGALGDNLSDDTSGIEAAITAASAAVVTVNGIVNIQPTVYFPSGSYIQTKPIFVPPNVKLEGDGPGSTVIAWKHADGLAWDGYSLLAAQENPSTYGLHFEAAVGGTALKADYDAGDRDHTETFLDLAQYHGGRLTPNWTIRFVRKFTSVTNGGTIFTIYAQTSWSNNPVLPTALNFAFNPFTLDGKMQIRFRFNNIYNDVAVSTASYVTLAAGVEYEFEIAYNNATGRLYIFVNGELWTNGAWGPPGGAGDGTKFLMWPWERMTVGSTIGIGYPSESILGAYEKGTWRGIHISEVVRHIANYTATPTVDPTADFSTRLLVNFDQTYKGHVVAKGISGNATVYLYPVLFHAEECAGIVINSLSILQGLGLRMEFASKLRMSEVDINYPDDGVLLTRNGYFASFDKCNVILGARGGWINEGGSGVTYNSLFASAPICFGLTSTNITANGCSAGIQGGGVTAVVAEAGSNNINGFLVDAELNTGNTWQAALVVSDAAAFVAIGGQWYNPPDQLSKNPVVVSNNTATAETSYNFIGSWFGITPTNVALIKLIGTQNPARKIVVAAPAGRLSGDLCTSKGQAWDPFAITDAVVTTAVSTVLSSGRQIVFVRGNVAPVTLTLPLAVTMQVGAVIVIKDCDKQAATHNITIARSGSDLIDGETSQVITVNGTSLSLISDGVSKYYLV